MSPRPRSVQDADVFAATQVAISRAGPAKLTIAMVAREAGLAPSTLVQRFGTKRALLLAFATQASQGPAEIFARAGKTEPDPLRVIRFGLRAMAASVRTRQRLSNHLAFLQIDLNDPDFRSLARDHGEALRRALVPLLADARARRQIDVDPEQAAVHVQVAYNGALVTWAVHGEGPLLDFIDRALDPVLGVRTHDALRVEQR